MSHAEQAYFFRHALLRDAAYQLHLPAERGRPDVAAVAWAEGSAKLRRLGNARQLETATRDMAEACAKAGIPGLESDPGGRRP